MSVQTKVRYLDHYAFKWCADKLKDATPDDIVAFYVHYFVFKNAEYMERITKLYQLPDDFLKLHKKIVELSEAEYEGMIKYKDGE